VVTESRSLGLPERHRGIRGGGLTPLAAPTRLSGDPVSTITLFDGLAVADFDGLPASASGWL